MEQILGKNCNQGHRTGYKKIRGTSSPAFFGLRGTVPGTKSSGALWILITHPNLGNGRETQNIGCAVNHSL